LKRSPVLPFEDFLQGRQEGVGCLTEKLGLFIQRPFNGQDRVAKYLASKIYEPIFAFLCEIIKFPPEPIVFIDGCFSVSSTS
jgi:hypothetical protein